MAWKNTIYPSHKRLKYQLEKNLKKTIANLSKNRVEKEKKN